MTRTVRQGADGGAERPRADPSPSYAHAMPITDSTTGPAAWRAAVTAVQSMPYRWPAPPDAAATRAAGAGSCAGKHALLAEELRALDIESRPLFIVGPLAPSIWPDLVEEAQGLLEVHECLTVDLPAIGPVLVDVTWHPRAVELGLPGTIDWDGVSDMRPAIEPVTVHAPTAQRLREQKELLRARLYSADDRRRRDAVLAQIATRARDL